MLKANQVARVQVLLDLINELSGVIVKVKKNGEFYKKIHSAKIFGRFTREIKGKSSWSHIGKFEDYLPSAFVIRPTNDHLLLYYGLPKYQTDFTKSPYWDLDIYHCLAMPCEICGKYTGDWEIDAWGRGVVECCSLCKRIFDRID